MLKPQGALLMWSLLPLLFIKLFYDKIGFTNTLSQYILDKSKNDQGRGTSSSD